jgi:predicted dehydrogenase
MVTPVANPIRVGMVGGGADSNIGETHRRALRLDGRLKLVAGVFTRDSAKNKQLSENLQVERSYRDFAEMAASESGRNDGIELAVIATPDESHFRIAREFLSRGISVACEKPLTQNSAEAVELIQIAEQNGAVLAVAHAYSAYAMVRHAARLVRAGELGELRFLDVQHASGWAATRVEDEGNPTVVWRMNPETTSIASVAADIGTHALHLARFISGDEPVEISAELTTLVPGRRVADCLTANLHWRSGMRGRLWATMAATGHNHGLRIRVYGSKASLEWEHEDPHHLILRDLAGAKTVLAQGVGGLSAEASRLTRTGLGHPEGFLEAFANYYSDIADALLAKRTGNQHVAREFGFPSGRDGLIGAQLVETVIASDALGGAWVGFPRSDEVESK